MSLSARSVQQIANVLSEDFNCYLQSYYDQQIGELLANAATEFIAQEMGEVDDDLFYELATNLVTSVKLTS